ncbi:MAG: HlyD family efflux transporter periplasmic adaptor subunit [Micropepsaceae bacterium]
MKNIVLAVLLALPFLTGCGAERERVANGYVEGDYVFVAAPEGGWLTELLVSRGKTIKAGEPLFTLDAETQIAQRDQALAGLAQAKAQLANVQKGRRPDEIAALEAAVAQAQASAKLAEAEYVRARDLKSREFVSQSFLDARRAQRDSAVQQLKQAQANLSLAGKGARDDEIAAARAGVAAANAALQRAEYALSQRRIVSRVDGRVQDTLRSAGEFVPPGGAIVQILPPNNVHLRFFVPESLRAKIKVGAIVGVSCDGCGDSLNARIVFLSTTAEYTPPVIYSIGSREKLVWMVEAIPEKGTYLSPGQPVDVVLP